MAQSHEHEAAERLRMTSAEQEKAQRELAHVLTEAHSVLLVFSQAGEVERAAASALAASHKPFMSMSMTAGCGRCLVGPQTSKEHTLIVLNKRLAVCKSFLPTAPCI